MAMKSEHNGAKNGGGAWDSRANAKTRSKKLRREESRALARGDGREQAREYGDPPRQWGCRCCGADLSRESHARWCENDGPAFEVPDMEPLD